MLAWSLLLGCAADLSAEEAEVWLRHEVNETSGGASYVARATFAAEPPLGRVGYELEGRVFDPLEGIDDCEGLEITGESPGVGRTLASAGEVTLIEGDRTHALEPVNPGDYRWFTDEMPAGATLSASGDDVPGLDAIPLPPLPDTLGNVSFEVDPADGRGELVWAPGGGGDLVFELVASSPALSLPAYRVRCALVDDGAFVVPASVLSELPAEGMASWRLTRAHEALQQLDDGRVVSLYADREFVSDFLALPDFD